MKFEAEVFTMRQKMGWMSMKRLPIGENLGNVSKLTAVRGQSPNRVWFPSSPVSTWDESLMGEFLVVKTPFCHEVVQIRNIVKFQDSARQTVGENRSGKRFEERIRLSPPVLSGVGSPRLTPFLALIYPPPTHVLTTSGASKADTEWIRV